MPLVQCGGLRKNNEKDICTLVLKTGLVIELAPHTGQTWPYLKINQIRLANSLKAKNLWGCSGFSNSIIFNVPLGLNEVIDRGPGDHRLFTAKPLGCQQFCVYSASFCPNPISICHNAPHISQKMLLPWAHAHICSCRCELLWAGVTTAKGTGIVLAEDKRTGVT